LLPVFFMMRFFSTLDFRTPFIVPVSLTCTKITNETRWFSFILLNYNLKIKFIVRYSEV